MELTRSRETGMVHIFIVCPRSHKWRSKDCAQKLFRKCSSTGNLSTFTSSPFFGGTSEADPPQVDLSLVFSVWDSNEYEDSERFVSDLK